MEYVVSEYNFFVPRADGAVIYNAARGSFTRVDASVLYSLHRLQVPELSDEYLAALEKAGIIHRGDQKAKILAKFEFQKASRSHLNFTIAPTIECNYACWYCYQNERRYTDKMTASVQESVLSFIDLVAKSSESIDITWYGGEPILALDVIENISLQLREKYKNRKPKVLQSSIITNGILLSEDVVGRLKRCGVLSGQISVDNFYHEPPSRRGLLLKDGSHSPILANILKFRDQLSLSIRINTSSLEEAAKINEELGRHGLHGYFARVEDNVSECSSLGSKVVGNLMPRKSYARAVAELTEAQGLKQYVEHAQNSLRPKSHACGATLGNMFVIDFRGDISRCWISAGLPEERIGNVCDIHAGDLKEDNLFTDSEVDRQWREYTPFNFDDCRDCRVLPLCMGGCSHARVLHGAVKPPCESIKYNINKYVADIGARLPLAE